MIPSRLRRAAALLVCTILFFSASLAHAAEAAYAPRLIVFLIVDGLSESEFSDEAYAYEEGGFLRLMQQGAWFEEARHGHAATLTGPGHATILTGTDPFRHGIVANFWLDRKTGAKVVCADAQIGASRLRVPTFGDALVDGTRGGSRVFAVGGKARSAVLCAGRKGVAYYYDRKTSKFVRVPAGKTRWKYDFKRQPDGAYPEDAMTFDFAEELIDAERLGDDWPDLLVLALSSMDLVNHRYGPDSRESRTQLHALDRRLARFLKRLDAKIGLKNTLIVLTADHGFTQGKSVGVNAMTSGLDAWLESVFGRKGLVLGTAAPWVYLNVAEIKSAKLDPKEVEKEAKAYLSKHPGVADVFSQSDAFEGTTPLAKAVRRSWDPSASGDLYLVPEEGSVFLSEDQPEKAGHGTPYDADTHVPVIFFGTPFPDGLYDDAIETVDIAPTVAEAIGLKLPPVEGTPLTATFEKARKS